jgi:Domain of unknown function (DUF4383)
MTSRRFAQLIGVLFLAVGILGFIPGFVSNPHPNAVPGLFADEGYGLLIGLFPVNWIHNLVHLGVGIAGLSLSSTTGKARSFARGLTWFYGFLAVMGSIPALSMLFGLAPLHGWDVFLHGGTAAFAAYYGYGKQAQGDEIAERYRRVA